jgi:hypothetical protein
LSSTNEKNAEDDNASKGLLSSSSAKEKTIKDDNKPGT